MSPGRSRSAALDEVGEEVETVDARLLRVELGGPHTSPLDGGPPEPIPGIADDEARGKFDAEWGIPVPPEPGLHLSLMFEAMERGEIRSLFVLGENPAQSEADATRARRLLNGLDFMVVQDMFLTKTAELADVVLPAAASWAETDGTVTSSERRVQRVRKALDPPGEAKDDIEIISLLADRLGHGWGNPTAEEVWEMSWSRPSMFCDTSRLETRTSSTEEEVSLTDDERDSEFCATCSME